MSRAILQIAFGADAGRKFVLAPGDVLRIGRGDECDVRLVHDRALASVHFEIDWDGHHCYAHTRLGDDLRLGGRRIDRAVIPHGGWLHAGGSAFLLHHERHTPTSSPRLDEVRTSTIVTALRERAKLWAVVDAARTPRILQVLREAVDPARSLYEGPRGDGMVDAAPHLVELQPDSHLLSLLVREGWGNAWGIYLSWDTTEKEARRHLRRLLMVEVASTREPLYFRFYDPRALRDVIPTCSVRQQTELFGDIDAFLLEGEDGEVRCYDREGIVPTPGGEA